MISKETYAEGGGKLQNHRWLSSPERSLPRAYRNHQFHVYMLLTGFDTSEEHRSTQPAASPLFILSALQIIRQRGPEQRQTDHQIDDSLQPQPAELRGAEDREQCANAPIEDRVPNII